MTDSARRRQRLAERLVADKALVSPVLRTAVEAVPRELFLQPGVFLDEGTMWRPVSAAATAPAEWLEIAYRHDSLTTQLDGHLTADQTTEPVAGVPTSSSTTPATVIRMIEALDPRPGHRVLEIGTGTGYSSALMCHCLGADHITTVEVDPQVAQRADLALEALGYSAWTVTGDGLLGHPRNAPYDRVIATCAIRRIPHAWVRQTAPGGTILATLGSWPFGTGLAKLTVGHHGQAEGRIVSRSSFMHARSQAPEPLAGDLSARTAYPDSERRTKVSPALLDDWTPAFVAQLAAPGTQLVRATRTDGTRLLYLLDPGHESFAEFAAVGVGDGDGDGDGDGWIVRQGGPVLLWDRVEAFLLAWQAANRPDIDTVRIRVTQEAHHYWIEGVPDLRWEHRVH
ncbi:putative O-methyltransferase [Actinacidiphila reveromycinica]|uniref:Protein-L-isoaspartate O-methyltransferase n=1 Tax=Actinacidiphila reveromycinica TaxID=659352 RepID=A0A7U3UUQ3_9ACTN|nr:ATP-grasp peptide maturase system methyltransferase [Streptomyces sp. SN-593]BBA98961.1 putative O-methyltransferase [Streptomyces sp. SN-593]